MTLDTQISSAILVDITTALIQARQAGKHHESACWIQRRFGLLTAMLPVAIYFETEARFKVRASSFTDINRLDDLLSAGESVAGSADGLALASHQLIKKLELVPDYRATARGGQSVLCAEKFLFWIMGSQELHRLSAFAMKEQMNSKNLTSSEACAVYRVLVSEAGATGGADEESFVLEFTSDRPTNEWRFCGGLGFGGKFRFPLMTVDCYPEDETPERLVSIARTNEKLKAIKESRYRVSASPKPELHSSEEEAPRASYPASR